MIRTGELALSCEQISEVSQRLIGVPYKTEKWNSVSKSQVKINTDLQLHSQKEIGNEVFQEENDGELQLYFMLVFLIVL